MKSVNRYLIQYSAIPAFLMLMFLTGCGAAIMAAGSAATLGAQAMDNRADHIENFGKLKMLQFEYEKTDSVFQNNFPVIKVSGQFVFEKGAFGRDFTNTTEHKFVYELLGNKKTIQVYKGEPKILNGNPASLAVGEIYEFVHYIGVYRNQFDAFDELKFKTRTNY